MKSPWLWTVCGVVVVLIIALAMGSVRVRDFLSSGDFQKLVEHHAGVAVRGEVELSPLRWSGPSVFSESMRGRGGEGSNVHEFEAAHLRADWNWRAVFFGAWSVEEITVESLRGSFGPLNGLNAESASSSPSLSPGWLAAFFPKRFELGQVSIQRADLDFRGVSLRNSALKIRPDGSAWTFTGTGGNLSVPHWPVLGVDFFQARWSGDRLRIDRASLREGVNGRISASGVWPGKIDLDWTGVPLSPLLPSPWRDMVSGNLSGTAAIESQRAGGRFEFSDGVVRGAEWLETLATLTGRDEFRRLMMQKATGTWTFRQGAWHWDDLILESEGLLRVEGRVLVSSDRRLSGELRLGVAAELLRPLPGAREKVFTESRDGFVWTPVSLGGTLDSPEENLSARLATAAGDQVLEAVQPILEAVPGGAGEAVGETINTLFDMLGR